MRILQRLTTRGFEIVAFPMYANHIGVRRGNCAALLTQLTSGGLAMYTEPAFLIGGNFSARINRKGRGWFVWKNEKLEATQSRLEELEGFSRELRDALLPAV